MPLSAKALCLLMSSVVGPVEGSMGDWRLWKESGIEDHLRALFFSDDSTERLYVYGDPAYYGGLGVMGAYRALPGEELTAQQLEFNRHMSAMRISVEHGFGICQE
jgi:hypothetical protein